MNCVSQGFLYFQGYNLLECDNAQVGTKVSVCCWKPLPSHSVQNKEAGG